MILVAALSASASAGPDGPVVMLSGEADATTAARLREILARQLKTGARLVTVDASGLAFLDSASLRVLVLAAKALRGRHGTLVLARPQPVVARLLEITGADRLLDVRALAGLAGPRPADQAERDVRGPEDLADGGGEFALHRRQVHRLAQAARGGCPCTSVTLPTERSRIVTAVRPT